MCKFDGCDKRASFNQKGETKALFCLAHKTDGMISVLNAICIDCNVQACFTHFLI